MLKEKYRAEKDNVIFENGWEQTRILWATLRNVHGDKAKPTDLIKLSRDEVVEKQQIRRSPEEVAKKFSLTGKK